MSDQKRRLERMWVWLAWSLPRSLAYWCAIRVWTHATTGKYADQTVTELTAIDALKRWGKHEQS